MVSCVQSAARSVLGSTAAVWGNARSLQRSLPRCAPHLLVAVAARGELLAAGAQRAALVGDGRLGGALGGRLERRLGGRPDGHRRSVGGVRMRAGRHDGACVARGEERRDRSDEGRRDRRGRGEAPRAARNHRARAGSVRRRRAVRRRHAVVSSRCGGGWCQAVAPSAGAAAAAMEPSCAPRALSRARAAGRGARTPPRAAPRRHREAVRRRPAALRPSIRTNDTGPPLACGPDPAQSAARAARARARMVRMCVCACVCVCVYACV